LQVTLEEYPCPLILDKQVDGPLFADNILLWYNRSVHITDKTKTRQDDWALNLISNCADPWKVIFSTDETQTILFANKRSDEQSLPKFSVCGQLTSFSYFYKYLILTVLLKGSGRCYPNQLKRKQKWLLI